MDLDQTHLKKLGFLSAYFIILAFLLWNHVLADLILHLLVISALIWFFYEYLQKRSPAELNIAFELGIFLMLFDFIVENAGAVLGLWQVVQTTFHVAYVPIEIMALTLIGGAAWALAQPGKFTRINSAIDILFFSAFGALGEYMLIKNNIMHYANGWTSMHAFLGYFITWSLLHYLRYRVLPLIRK